MEPGFDYLTNSLGGSERAEELSLEDKIDEIFKILKEAKAAERGEYVMP